MTLEQAERVADPLSEPERFSRFERWSSSRARLNHDWLQNQYLIFLAARQQDLRAMGCGEKSRLEVRAQLLEWEHQEKAFLELADQTEQALSPRQLLDIPPLDQLPLSEKVWLGDLIHELYCARTDLRSRVAALRATIVTISRVVRDLANLENPKSTILREACPAELLAQCRRLSSLISGLPHRVEL